MTIIFVVGNRVRIKKGEKLQLLLEQFIGKEGVIHYIHPRWEDVREKKNIQPEQAYRRYQVRLRTGENVAFPEDWLELLEEG